MSLESTLYIFLIILIIFTIISFVGLCILAVAHSRLGKAINAMEQEKDISLNKENETSPVLSGEIPVINEDAFKKAWNESPASISESGDARQFIQLYLSALPKRESRQLEVYEAALRRIASERHFINGKRYATLGAKVASEALQRFDTVEPQAEEVKP